MAKAHTRFRKEDVHITKGEHRITNDCCCVRQEIEFIVGGKGEGKARSDFDFSIFHFHQEMNKSIYILEDEHNKDENVQYTR